eukprot:1756010-Heterocapsa_arctica.AAC.1
MLISLPTNFIVSTRKPSMQHDGRLDLGDELAGTRIAQCGSAALAHIDVAAQDRAHVVDHHVRSAQDALHQ